MTCEKWTPIINHGKSNVVAIFKDEKNAEPYGSREVVPNDQLSKIQIKLIFEYAKKD